MANNNTLWIETFSGKKVNPLSANSHDLDIEDIAHSLSLQCRFNGHCTKFYSVAEHSINTATHILNSCKKLNQTAKYQIALFALLHDATEAYLCDIPRPLKKFIQNYNAWEENLSKLIFAKFANRQPTASEWKIVLSADNALLSLEASLLTKNAGKDWNLSPDKNLKVKIKCFQWKKAKKEFLSLFKQLTAKLANQHS